MPRVSCTLLPHSIPTHGFLQGLKYLDEEFQGVLLLVRLVRVMLWESFTELIGALPEKNLT